MPTSCCSTLCADAGRGIHWMTRCSAIARQGRRGRRPHHDERDRRLICEGARGLSRSLYALAQASVSWPKTLIYERTCAADDAPPLVADNLRGSFAGLAEPAIIAHLQRIGVTTIELLPVHAFAQDQFLSSAASPITGYNTLAFFAPEPRYLASASWTKSARAIDRLHQAGHRGDSRRGLQPQLRGQSPRPTLSMPASTMPPIPLMPGEPRSTTTSAAAATPLTPAIRACCRWAGQPAAVDHGLRRRRLSALTRRHPRPPPGGLFAGSRVFHAHPAGSGADRDQADCRTLDVGPRRLPARPLFRPVFRSGTATTAMWSAATGADITACCRASHPLRRLQRHFLEGTAAPGSSVNFITAHDGFTLQDTVSYNEKHNEANARTTATATRTTAAGIAASRGETDDPAIITLRNRQKAQHAGPLLLSEGVPMLLAGDECGNSQAGNNNAYCQDNEIADQLGAQRRAPDRIRRPAGTPAA